MDMKYQSRDQYQLQDQDCSRGVDYNKNGSGERLDVDPWADNGNGGRLDVDPWADDSRFSPGETKAGSEQTRLESRGDVVSDLKPPQIVSASNDFNFSRAEVNASSEQTRRESGWDVVSSEATRSGYGVRSYPIVVMSETEKMWNYQDPTGMVHGPFAMEQLRTWNTTGLFPPNFTIWKTGHDKETSEVLLIDALAGRFKETSMKQNQNADGESGKSTFGRRSSGREYDAPVRSRDALSRSRGGTQSARVLERMDVPCKYYARGYCRRGDVCEFRHR